MIYDDILKFFNLYLFLQFCTFYIELYTILGRENTERQAKSYGWICPLQRWMIAEFTRFYCEFIKFLQNYWNYKNHKSSTKEQYCIFY